MKNWMFCGCVRMVVMVCGLFTALSAQAGDLAIGSEVWDAAPAFQVFRFYYLNNNFSAAGNPLAGAFFGSAKGKAGPQELKASDGSLVHAYDNGPDASKCALQLGEYIFFTHKDRGGIRRMDSDWTSHVTPYVNPGNTEPESIVSDDKHIFANNDKERNKVHAYRVENKPNAFTLTEVWVVTLGSGGRVRGLGYWEGYVYASIGAAGTDRSIYAIKAADGTVTDMGIDVPGTAMVYGVIRRDNLLMAITLDNLYVWDMTSATSVDPDSLDTYSKSFLTGGDSMYGVSYDGKKLYISHNEIIARKARPRSALGRFFQRLFR